MDLMTASPREVDEHGAELYNQRAEAYASLRNAYDTAHYLLDEKPNKTRGGKIIGWPTTDSGAAIELRTAKLMPHEEAQRERTLAQIQVSSDKINNLNADLIAVSAAFIRRGGWSRFFTVDGGHIHSGETCAGGTIRPTTRLGWNPELSGKTEADAVAALGPLLCTHCFPTAPVEWTRKPGEKPIPAGYCQGQRQAGENPQMQYISPVGTCPVCKTVQSLSKAGNILKHKAPKS